MYISSHECRKFLNMKKNDEEDTFIWVDYMAFLREKIKMGHSQKIREWILPMAYMN